MRFNFITGLLFASALARAAPAPAPSLPGSISADGETNVDNFSGKIVPGYAGKKREAWESGAPGLDLETRDPGSIRENNDHTFNGLAEELAIAGHVHKREPKISLGGLAKKVPKKTTPKKTTPKKTTPKKTTPKKTTPKKNPKASRTSSAAPSKTSAPACTRKKNSKTTKGRVGPRAINDGCESPRNVYRIRMENMFADPNSDETVEEQDHCGIFIGDEDNQDNHGNLYHVRYITNNENKDKSKPDDQYVYERKELKKGLASKTARPKEVQEKIGEVSSVEQLKLLEQTLATLATPGTKSGGFTCQKWTNLAVSTIGSKKLVDKFKQPTPVKNKDRQGA